MRWVRLGGAYLGLGATMLAACGSSSGSASGFGFGNTVGGSANGGTGVFTAGSLNLGGTPNVGGQPTGLDACRAPALYFPITRYSTADVDASLDLVFGKGPRLVDAFSGQEVGVSFVRALAGIARARVAPAAAEAAELEVCDDDAAADANCIQVWLRDYGGKLYRRPLEPQQLAGYLAAFQSTTDQRATAENALVSMILSPYFSLRLETATQGALDNYGIAARLAHFATRSVPDAELIASAASGHIADPLERLTQLHRLWSTPAGRAARTRFALDLLGLPDPDERSDLEPELLRDLSSQTHAFVDGVYEEDFGSYQALLGKSRLPLNDRLAAFYGVAPPGTDELVETELDPSSFAGLLTSGAFTTRYPRPTSRGIAIVERLLCSEGVPAPFSGHDFELPRDLSPRDGLARSLAVNPTCTACHQIFDPPGLALSAFDAAGHLSGLDSSGGVRLPTATEALPVANPRELADVLAESNDARVCLERRFLEHVLGRELNTGGEIFVRTLPAPLFNPDEEWLTCVDSLLGRTTPNLTLLSEAIVQSSLMVLRADTPRRVVALDSSNEPIEHALAETQQLLDSYQDQNDNDLLRLYLASLESARDAAVPTGAGGDGAGGAP